MTTKVVGTIAVDRLGRDRARVDSYLAELLSPAARQCGMAMHAMRYAVLGGGQRVRPVLALRIARACGLEDASAMRAAAAVELLHCASLIVDDLPCMDNAATRRGRPATHVAYGEAVAVLAAFGLVAMAGRIVLEGCPPEDLPRVVRFQEYLLGTLDCDALIAGQVMDLRGMAESDRLRVADLKTVPLFELAARAGTLFADPGIEPAMLDFARSYGAAFQLVDDYIDGDPVPPVVVRAALQDSREKLGAAGYPAEVTDLVDWLEERAA